MMTRFAMAQEMGRQADDYWHWYGYRDQWAIRYELTEEELAAMPPWKETDETPPTTPRSALKAANHFVNTLHKQGIFRKASAEYELEEIALVHLEGAKWIWIVRYGMEKRPKVPGTGGGGMPDVTDVVVLMSGKIPRHYVKNRTD